MLLRAAGFDKSGAAAPGGDAHLTQSELGEMANLSRRIVSHVLARLDAAGWISIGYNRIAIVDAKALATFAAEER